MRSWSPFLPPTLLLACPFVTTSHLPTSQAVDKRANNDDQTTSTARHFVPHQPPTNHKTQTISQTLQHRFTFLASLYLVATTLISSAMGHKISWVLKTTSYSPIAVKLTNCASVLKSKQTSILRLHIDIQQTYQHALTYLHAVSLSVRKVIACIIRIISCWLLTW